MAVTMLSLATFNWQLRLGDDPSRYVMPWGLGMMLTTIGFISLAAYLGGSLVYESAVGVHTD